jgi:DNA invertase Pin-like site-specific DNA recombinase
MLPKLRAIIPDRLAAERKKERDLDRFGDHYTREGVRASNEDKRASARLMRLQGSSFREIAKELGVDVRTVHRWCDRE